MQRCAVSNCRDYSSSWPPVHLLLVTLAEGDHAPTAWAVGADVRVTGSNERRADRADPRVGATYLAGPTSGTALERQVDALAPRLAVILGSVGLVMWVGTRRPRVDA